MLKGLGDAVNPDCEFHRHNQDTPLPSERLKVLLKRSMTALLQFLGLCVSSDNFAQHDTRTLTLTLINQRPFVPYTSL